VRAFQQALELTLDGVVGTQTSRWLTQVAGVPLILGPTGSPSTWARRYTACLDLKTAGFCTAAAGVIGDAATTGLTVDRVIHDPRLHAVLQHLGTPLHAAGILTPRMQGEVAAAARTAKPLTAWVALDVVPRLSSISLRCAASLEWPPRQDGV
jgi:hypothetical protein